MPKKYQSMEWDDKFTIDNGPIDADHKMLIKILNRVQKRATGLDQINVSRIFDEIMFHIVSHFAKEEIILKKIMPELYEEHRAEHKKILNGLTTISESFKNKQSHAHERFDEIADYLRSIILGHMMDYDMKMCGHEDEIRAITQKAPKSNNK